MNYGVPIVFLWCFNERRRPGKDVGRPPESLGRKTSRPWAVLAAVYQGREEGKPKKMLFVADCYWDRNEYELISEDDELILVLVLAHTCIYMFDLHMYSVCVCVCVIELILAHTSMT